MKRKRLGRRALLSDAGMQAISHMAMQGMEPWHSDLPKITSPMKALRRVMDLWKDRRFDDLALYAQPSWCLIQIRLWQRSAAARAASEDIVPRIDSDARKILVALKLGATLGLVDFDNYFVCKTKTGPLSNQRRMMVRLDGARVHITKDTPGKEGGDLYVVVNLMYELGGWYFNPISPMRISRTPAWNTV